MIWNEWKEKVRILNISWLEHSRYKGTIKDAAESPQLHHVRDWLSRFLWHSCGDLVWGDQSVLKEFGTGLREGQAMPDEGHYWTLQAGPRS